MKLKIPFILSLGLCQLISSNVLSQGLCDKKGGDFELNVYEGCAPLTVLIKNTTPNPILLSYNATYDGASLTPAFYDVPLWTYRDPGIFTMIQQVAISAGAFYACKQVKVYESRGVTAQYSSCGGGKINLFLINDAILNAYDRLEIKWGDGNSETWNKGDGLILQHVYGSTTGSPVMSIKGIYTGNGACAGGNTLTIPVSFQQAQLNGVQVKTAEMKANGSLELTYTGLTAISTSIESSPDGVRYTTHGVRSTGGSAIFYRIEGLSPSQVYKLKLSSKDLCGGQLDSDVVTSMVISGKSEDERNLLSWNKYPVSQDFIEYELFRDGISVKKFAIGETSYIDEEVQCGDQFEYYIVTKTQKVVSTSAPVSVKTEIAQAKPITQGMVTVNGDNQISISTTIPGVGPKSIYDLTIERAEAGSTTFKKIATIQNQNEFVDLNVNTNELSYCYRLSYQNSCGQKLPATEPICTILLTNSFSSFAWNVEKPFLASIKLYDVLQVGTTGSKEIPRGLSNTFQPEFNADSDLKFTFQVRATSSDGNFQSLSNTVSYVRSAGVFVPSAFSPNGDVFNPELLAVSARLQSFKMTIYNRWGKVIFYSEDITQGWNGKIDGVEAPVGSYVYKVSFVDDINQKVEKSGTFMLLR